jgi:hypothetical protein
MNEVSSASFHDSSNDPGADGSPASDLRTTETSPKCREGATEACKTPIAASMGYYLCGLGSRRCEGREWSMCTTKETSAGLDEWTPIEVGCDAPPEPCERAGQTQACLQHLPPEGLGENNCYHGRKTCQNGAWSTCMQPTT